MGLDNGIRIKKEKLSKDIFLDTNFLRDDYEPLYWRKCWGLRDDIVEYLRDTKNIDKEDVYDFDLDLVDLREIYTIVSSWNNKKKWKEESRSIWNWKEMKDQLAKDCECLVYLIAKKEEYGDDLPLYFYDSY